MMYYQYVYFFTTYNMNAKKILELIQSNNSDGFTVALKGKVGQFVVAFTHCEGSPWAIAEKLDKVLDTLPKDMESITL